MNYWTKATNGPGNGAFPGGIVERCINRSGSTIALGEVVALNVGETLVAEISDETGNYKPGSDTSVWRSVITPTATQITDGGIFCICLEQEGVENDQDGLFQFFGMVDQALVTSTGTGDSTSRLTLTTGKVLDAEPAVGEVVVGQYMDVSDASLGTPELKQVFFDGYQLLANG